jgi:hypothetical protein
MRKKQTFDQLTLIDKTQCLHLYFPNEIPQLLDFIKDRIILFLTGNDNFDRYPLQHNNCTSQMWRELLSTLSSSLVSNSRRYKKNSRYFATELNKGYTRYFLSDCIQHYFTRTDNTDFIKGAAFYLNLKTPAHV